MIKYQMICDKSHEFEGWFGNSATFESQQESGLLTCPVCGSADVRRALMAPNLASPKTRKTDLAEQQPSAQPEPQPQPQAPLQASAALSPAAARKKHELMSADISSCFLRAAAGDRAALACSGACGCGCGSG